MKIRMGLRRLAALLTAIVCVLTMSGCWDTAEINGRAFVLGVGVDDGEREGDYDFTFQLAVPVSGGSDSGDAIQYINCTLTDRSAAAAIRSLEKNIGRQINFEQLTAIIIGEHLSHGRFTQVTELFFRRASVRRQSCVAVCSGRAEDFFAVSSTGKSISSDAAIALQSYDTRSGTGSMVMNLHSLYTAVSNADGFYLMQISAVDPSEQNTPTDSGEISDENKKLILEISGASVYDGGCEYMGEIGSDELEILRLIANSQTSGIISAAGTGESGGDKPKEIYYQIKQSHCVRQCRIADGIPDFSIILDLQCSLVDGYGLGEWEVTSEQFTDFAEKCIVKELTAEIGAIADKSRRSLGAAALGLQDILRQREPDWYDAHADSLNEIYKHSDIKINISCEVVGGGMTQ
ncbi:MAG: Ger(x)C family spore germination protein [Firmicutes bacterium]|nr:Ger(x)C family spore germination protein [Bacillota bacterium]